MIFNAQVQKFDIVLCAFQAQKRSEEGEMACLSDPLQNSHKRMPVISKNLTEPQRRLIVENMRFALIPEGLAVPRCNLLASVLSCNQMANVAGGHTVILCAVTCFAEELKLGPVYESE
jgi:hypothetical protein